MGPPRGKHGPPPLSPGRQGRWQCPDTLAPQGCPGGGDILLSLFSKSWEGPGRKSLESQPAHFTGRENEALRGAGTDPRGHTEFRFTVQVFSLEAKPCSNSPDTCQPPHHDIMSLHFSLLAGQLLAFQLEAGKERGHGDPTLYDPRRERYGHPADTASAPTDCHPMGLVLPLPTSLHPSSWSQFLPAPPDSKGLSIHRRHPPHLPSFHLEALSSPG